ncbi:LOB domain-containing protein [Trifolium repens]|nr:LOB domain-containing protein [Trifolium repens]KAK2387358.1 LOB domain-containing protein [Trifolium repens]
MSSSNSPCAACKYLRRKCTQECDFAPYFLPESPQRFANVHRVFGASNVAKLLKELNAADREDAVKSLAYEAESRIKDPVYGCVGLISMLQQRLKEIQQELHAAKRELSSYNLNPQTMQYLLAHSGTVVMPQHQQQQQQWNNAQFAGFANNFPPEIVGGGGIVIRDVQQQQQNQELLEAHQLFAAQQQYMLRFGGGHQMGAGGGVAAVSDHADGGQSLGIGNFDNAAGAGGGGGAAGVGYYQIQQQGGGEQQQQNYHHNVGVPAAAAAHGNPIEAQLLLSPQNQENGEDGKSVGSTHHSC